MSTYKTHSLETSLVHPLLVLDNKTVAVKLILGKHAQGLLNMVRRTEGDAQGLLNMVR